MNDGKPMFEMIAYAGSIDVTLRIPLEKSNRYITFKRTYENKGISSEAVPDIKNNKGFIIENQFGLTIYPFLKTGNDDKANYRVMLIDRDISPNTMHLGYDLKFYKDINNELIQYSDRKNRSIKEVDNVGSNFFVIEKEFDYIEVQHNNASGIVIPLFSKVSQGTSIFTFAIDFGTTNTHIEYKVDNGNPRPFEITSNDIQIATLHDPQVEEIDNTLSGSGAFLIYNLIPHEFLPEKLGKDFEFSFPQRTIISENKNLNPNTATYSLADFNIPFIYEKQRKRPNSKVSTNLKWTNYTLSDIDRKRVESFFEKLIFLIRNKVLLNGGNIENTNLIWFYPSSMTTVRRNSLERMWNDLFRKYINSNSVPVKLSESIAPFYYFKNKGGIDASDLPVASIDIGGGTSDIVVYQNNKPVLLTSFRFAANSIFGDGFNGSPELNGFVQRYKSKIEDLLNSNFDKIGNRDLVSVLEEISSDNNSLDIINFFFSIENNQVIKQKRIPISFNKELENDSEFKIIFIVFYSALIYHLAKLMLVKGIQAPRYITFSGTGSKLINIADSSIELKSLQKLTKLIFEKVYSTELGKIDLKQYHEPKEITCKGGLLSEIKIEIDELKTVLLGDKEDTLIPDKSLSYSQIQSSKELESVVAEVNEFLDLVFGLNNTLNFADNFDVNPALLKQYKSLLKEDLMQYLKSGLEIKLKENVGNENLNIEEPLFFYPLTGAINKLAYGIATKLLIHENA